MWKKAYKHVRIKCLWVAEAWICCHPVLHRIWFSFAHEIVTWTSNLGVWLNWGCTHFDCFAAHIFFSRNLYSISMWKGWILSFGVILKTIWFRNCFLTILIIFSIKVSNVTFDSFNSRYAMWIKNITTDEALFDIFNLLGIVKDGIR